MPLISSPARSRAVTPAALAAALVAVAVFAPAAPAAAQLPGPAAPTSGRIEGRVVLAGTDLPVAGAALIIHGPAGVTYATTREDGGFVADALVVGVYEILIEAPGLRPGRALVQVQSDGVSQVALALEAEAAGAEEVIEMHGRARDESQLLRESAAAVVVVDTARARRASADLGEVLARSQGVGVRRSGGLGSEARFSLDGLQDDQIRFFLDGVPLELAGYGLGIANVPVNLIEQVEIYRGVVPSRFGSDALGGTVNLVSRQGEDRAASVSYQAGSFGTHRATASVRAPVAASAHVRGAAFVDVARNDYRVDVEVPDERGRLAPARVQRFHDGYRAAGGNLDVNVATGPGDERLVASGFVTAYEKDLQHNLVMTVPYGEVRYGELSMGGTLRWQAPRLSERAGASVLVTYGHRRIDFVDRSPWIYDWFGNRVGERSQPGEIDGDAFDETSWQDSVMARAGVDVAVARGHTLRIALSPTATTRTGRDRLHTGGRDPLSARHDLLQLVTGVEHELDALDDRLENVLFLKGYAMLTASDAAPSSGVVQPLERTLQRLGVGDAMRLRLGEDLWLKASYELATRLPRPDELFGDGVTIKPSLALEPETSHNGNAGVGFDLRATRAGRFRGEVHAFLRHADGLIFLLGDDRAFTYQNLLSGRVMGAETALAWTASAGWLELDGSATLQDQRNTSKTGPYGAYEGDRIPNRPWLLASGGARLRRADVLGSGVELWAEWATRYVHRFYRGWESAGRRDSKQVVPSQLVHTVLIGASRPGRPLVTATAELHNLTDARAYDFFGVERPGRAFFFKLTAEY